MTTQALERLERAPVVDVEAVGVGQHLRARELREHLALPRRLDLELVQEGRDRRVVAGEEPQPVERAVELRSVLAPRVVIG